MRVWRICARRHAGSMDGEGARRFGGRWSSRGIAVVYASESIALATLEAFVHFDSNTIAPGLVLVAIDLPAGARIADLPKRPGLSKDWRSYPAPAALKPSGDAWARAGRTAVLRVASVIIPESFNYLVNPAHPDAAKIRHAVQRPFVFDTRMLG